MVTGYSQHASNPPLICFFCSRMEVYLQNFVSLCIHWLTSSSQEQVLCQLGFINLGASSERVLRTDFIEHGPSLSRLPCILLVQADSLRYRSFDDFPIPPLHLWMMELSYRKKPLESCKWLRQMVSTIVKMKIWNLCKLVNVALQIKQTFLSYKNKEKERLYRELLRKLCLNVFEHHMRKTELHNEVSSFPCGLHIAPWPKRRGFILMTALTREPSLATIKKIIYIASMYRTLMSIQNYAQKERLNVLIYKIGKIHQFVQKYFKST